MSQTLLLAFVRDLISTSKLQIVVFTVTLLLQ